MRPSGNGGRACRGESPLWFSPGAVPCLGDGSQQRDDFARQIVKLTLAARAIRREAGAKDYLDQALSPVGDDELEKLDLQTETAGARSAIAHQKKVALLTASVRAH